MHFTAYITVLTKEAGNKLVAELMKRDYEVGNFSAIGDIFTSHYDKGSLCELMVLKLENPEKKTTSDIAKEIKAITVERNISICSFVITGPGEIPICSAGNLKPLERADTDSGPYRSTGKFAEGV